MTDGAIGTPETLASTALCGAVYALVSGQPLTLIGPVMPVVIFTQVLFDLADLLGFPFLQFYAWSAQARSDPTSQPPRSHHLTSASPSTNYTRGVRSSLGGERSYQPTAPIPPPPPPRSHHCHHPDPTTMTSTRPAPCQTASCGWPLTQRCHDRALSLSLSLSPSLSHRSRPVGLGDAGGSCRTLPGERAPPILALVRPRELAPFADWLLGPTPCMHAGARTFCRPAGVPGVGALTRVPNSRAV